MFEVEIEEEKPPLSSPLRPYDLLLVFFYLLDKLTGSWPARDSGRCRLYQPARPTALQSRLEKERRVDLRAEPNGNHHRGCFRCEPVTSAYPRGDFLTLWSTTGMSSLVTSRHGHWVFGCPSDHRSGMPEMGFQSDYESGQENKAAATANPLSSGSEH